MSLCYLLPMSLCRAFDPFEHPPFEHPVLLSLEAALSSEAFQLLFSPVATGRGAARNLLFGGVAIEVAARVRDQQAVGRRQ
jgi:hypothetical protein